MSFRTVNRLTEHAVQVAALLNDVADLAERDDLEEHFERILNRELYAASLAAQPANVVPLRADDITLDLAPVIDLFSRRV